MREDTNMKLIFEGIDEKTRERVVDAELPLGDTRMNGINSIDYQITFEGANQK